MSGSPRPGHRGYRLVARCRRWAPRHRRGSRALYSSEPLEKRSRDTLLAVFERINA
ncbi:hypothetical protein [Micromonospora sp. NPDC048830]|uniref:hypothetical protein n=1 Tax=Micromonospora sp. NPDC048830 TaxID=3364257 RepID=UPI0037103CAB